MDSVKNIFVSVKETSAGDEVIYGLTAREWVLRALEGTAHGNAQAEKDAQSRYVARITDDMCLVTAEAFAAARDYLVRTGEAAVRLGENGADVLLFDTKKQGSAKKSLRSEDFLSLTGGENRQVVYNRIKDAIVRKCVRAGARVADFSTVYIDAQVKIGKGAVIHPMTVIEGTAEIGENTSVGPYALVRNSVIGKGCRIGSFVEIKNSVVGDGVKCAHLAYIGDADVGGGTNVGCGVVFCNYDGKNKHRTNVDENCFIGANSNLIAPISVHKGAFIAAGSTVTDDVPEGAFVIARSRQTTKTDRVTVADKPAK